MKVKRLLNKTIRHMNSQEGFTLVELLVSVVILIFVSVALMQTALVNIEYNTKNALRDEASRLASETLDNMRDVSPITNMVIAYNNQSVEATRKVRNIEKIYTVITNASVINSVASNYGAEMTVRIEWGWKDEIYNTTISTVR